MKKIFVLAATLLASLSALAFTAGMTPAQVTAEVGQRVKNGEPTANIAAAAKAVGVAPTALQSALLASGRASNDVFNALVAAGFDPGVLAPATAAGRRESERGDDGFNQNSARSERGDFGRSHSSTIGGGGRGGASRS